MAKSANKGKKPIKNDKKPDIKDEKPAAKADEEVDSEEAEAEADTENEEPESDDVKEESDNAASEEPDDEISEDEAVEGSDEDEESEDDIKMKPVAHKKVDSTANEEFRKLPFIEKCKKDPMIPVCILLAFAAVMIGVIVLALPRILTPSMGMTLEDFRSGFNNSEIASYQLANGVDMGFRTPAYVNPKENPSILANYGGYKASGMYADFFDGPASYIYGVGMEGATRKFDDQLAYVRIYFPYDPEADETGDQKNGVIVYFANILETLYPELDFYSAMNLSKQILSVENWEHYYFVKGNYGVRGISVERDGNKYVVLDVMPRSAIRSSEIKEDLDATAAAATTAVSETSAPAESETVAESA